MGSSDAVLSDMIPDKNTHKIPTQQIYKAVMMVSAG